MFNFAAVFQVDITTINPSFFLEDSEPLKTVCPFVSAALGLGQAALHRGAQADKRVKGGEGKATSPPQGPGSDLSGGRPSSAPLPPPSTRRLPAAPTKAPRVPSHTLPHPPTPTPCRRRPALLSAQHSPYGPGVRGSSEDRACARWA